MLIFPTRDVFPPNELDVLRDEIVHINITYEVKFPCTKYKKYKLNVFPSHFKLCVLRDTARGPLWFWYMCSSQQLTHTEGLTCMMTLLETKEQD
jgi:hypothetical protein